MRSFFITGLIALLISPLVADDFSDQIKPILEKHCISCHGPKKQKGGITLHDIDSLDAGFKKFQLLENVIDQVEYEEMPPEDEDVLPTDAERKALIKALSKVVDRVKSGNIPQRAGRVTLRRLNRNEYHYTVRDLFGVTFNPSKDFPVDGAGGEGFDNMADALFSTPTLLEKYLAAAKKVVSAVYANPALKGKVIFATPESPKESKATAEKVLTYHATLAYRRRVNKDDLSPLLKAFAKGQQAGKNFEQSLRAPLTALLINPRFLFRAEHDEAGKDEWPLNDFELATRLSYFLWSSMPDRALFKIADAGQLRDPKVLRAQQPPFTPSAPVQRRLQGPPAKSKFLAVTPPPNVVLIFADDLGYGDLGCYGATKLKTPNIDKLAAEGRRFIDAHSSSAVCTPSRYGLLTGEYPFRGNNGKGIWGPAPVTSPLLIPTDTLTIADIFKKSGYDTAAFGKWHLGFGEGANKWKEPLRPGPQDLGFDYYFGMPVVNSAPPYVYVENDRIVGGDPNDPIVHLGRNKKDTTPITPIKPEEAQRSPNQFGGAVKAHKLFNDYEVGTKLTEKATAWIKDRKKKPFFCYLSTTNVHHPFTPAKRFQGTSESGVYGDFVHELDWIVGEVRKSLEDAGVADNTLIIFTSDNGGMFNLGGRAAAAKGHKINGDLLGSKFGIWEGGHRVPFIAWWPGKIEAGSISNQLTISVDLLATFATLTGHQLENQKDSINMLPALTGNPEKPLRTEMFITPNKPSHMAYRKGKWMYIPAKSDGGFRGSKPGQHAWGGAAVTKLVNTPNSDIVDGKLKKDAPPAQLYDLEADVNQTKNLYHKHPEIVEELSTMLKQAAPQSPHSKVRQPIKAATKYDQFKPLGNLRFTFESGKLAGWTIVKGETGRPVSDHVSLPKHKDRPFNQEGKYHLSTIDTGEGFSDNQQVIFFSPQFIIQGDRASFLASGGFDPDSLYVGLVDAETKKILLIAGGARGPQMKRTTWDVSKLKGKTVYLQIVDKNTEGWGHLTFDDFSVEGKLLND